MSRLIDADKIVFESANELGARYYGSVLFAAKPQIDSEPTVDAIPMDWLDAQIRGYASRLMSTELKALTLVKGMWEADKHGDL